MKAPKKLMMLLVISVMCAGFTACSFMQKEAQNGQNNEDFEDAHVSEPQATEPVTPDEEDIFEPDGSDSVDMPLYEFEIEARNWGVEGITVKYPMIVNTGMLEAGLGEKADQVNDMIMDDMSYLLETIKSKADDETLTIDGVFDYSQITPTVLSICYEIDYDADSLAYPVSLYHTLTMSLDQVAGIPLSDLFVIDETFVEDFKSYWMYAPFRDTDLEAAGVNIKEEIESLYSNEELIGLLSIPEAQYYLTNQGLIVSIGVPHALGDHLEMSMNYEFLESSMCRDNPIWENYMFLDGEAIEETLD
jgi:hypothetical protein